LCVVLDAFFFIFVTFKVDDLCVLL
jgi:hypothetical protein